MNLDILKNLLKLKQADLDQSQVIQDAQYAAAQEQAARSAELASDVKDLEDAINVLDKYNVDIAEAEPIGEKNADL